MCFERACWTLSFESTMADWLSMLILEASFYVKVSSVSIARIQIACCAAYEVAIYSASIEESATVVCFFELHAMTPFPIRNAYPEIDHRSSGFDPQSASKYPSSWKFL